MHALFKYFEENWSREPYPVIDHALRIDRLPDGSFHFYIHPANTDGVTTDFVCSADELKTLINLPDKTDHPPHRAIRPNCF